MEQTNLPSTKLHENSLGNNLAKAIKAGVKIRELKNDIPIAQALLYSYSLIGLKPENFPTGTEQIILMDFVRGCYGGLIAEEIKEAFKMAVAHKFQDLDVNCYQKFSPEYFGRVLACYYVWRMAQLQKPQEITHVEPEFNKMEYYEKCLFIPFDKFVAGESYPYSELDGWMFFDDLYKMGIRFANEDPEMRELFMAEARLRVPKKERRKVFDPIESDEDHEKRIKKYAKHLAFRNWIEEKQFEETDLRQLVIPSLNKAIQSEG